MKKKNLLLLNLLLCSFLFSCSTNRDMDITKNEEQVTNYFVDTEEALDVASYPNDFFDLNPKEGLTRKNNPREIENIKEIPGENGDIVYYLVNYKPTGFVIISADNRLNPILAFSDSNKISLHEENYPGGLVKWLETTKDVIQDVRQKNTEETKKSWNILKRHKPKPPIYADSIPILGEECEESITTTKKGPLLTTAWSQGKGYNALVPQTGCSEANGGRAHTGCVATAMAQVMKFHQHPNRYNWNNMPDSTATEETAKLMRDAGISVNTTYGCDKSGAYSSKVPKALKKKFGYADATYKKCKSFSHIFERIRKEIDANRPVILGGGRKGKWFIFNVQKGGHSWVCDGYIETVHLYSNCSKNIYQYLYMNWGWGGIYNGWFLAHRTNPKDQEYTYDPEIIYYIEP